jgi:hypothetical protein
MAIVDNAVAVAVKSEPAIVRFDPTRPCSHSIPIVIEQDDRLIRVCGFNAIPIQIQY